MSRKLQHLDKSGCGFIFSDYYWNYKEYIKNIVLEDYQNQINEKRISYFDRYEKVHSVDNWWCEAKKAERDVISIFDVKIRTRLKRKFQKKNINDTHKSDHSYLKGCELGKFHIKIVSSFLFYELDKTLHDAFYNYYFFRTCQRVFSDIDINNVILEVIRRFKKELGNTNLRKELQHFHIECGELDQLFKQEENNVVAEVCSDLPKELQHGELSEHNEEEEDVDKWILVEKRGRRQKKKE